MYKFMYMTKITGLKRKGYLWVTLIFFLLSLILHWYFGWKTFISEQAAHNQAVVFSDYFNEMMRDTMENWQSEFLQLCWQVAGLAFLFYVGSPTSKEGDDRKEEKIDALLRLHKGDQIIKELDEKYPKK